MPLWVKQKIQKCHGDISSTPRTTAAGLEAFFEESQKIDDHTFEHIGGTLGELIGELQSFDRISRVTAIAALQSVADNRNCIVRLDALNQRWGHRT